MLRLAVVVLCLLLPDLSHRAGSSQSNSLIERDSAVAKSEPGPHNGGGQTTGYSFFARAPHLGLVFRKRALHAGAAIGYHRQDEDEVYYVLSGTGELTLNGERTIVGPGTAILTRTGSSHGLRQTGSDDLVIIVTYQQLGSAGPLAAQSGSPAAADSLLQRLVGQWRMTGSVRGKPVAYTLDANRVLQGRFVELHMTDVSRPPQYEARVFIGADTAGGYIAHWLDNTGASYSVPPATGEARGDTVLLTFPYPHGAFRDTFVYDRRADVWRFRLDAADSTGGWRLFAEYEVRRR